MLYTSWYITFLNKIVESFDIEDWSNGNFATTRIHYILTFIKIENFFLFLKKFFLSLYLCSPIKLFLNNLYFIKSYIFNHKKCILGEHKILIKTLSTRWLFHILCSLTWRLTYLFGSLVVIITVDFIYNSVLWNKARSCSVKTVPHRLYCTYSIWCLTYRHKWIYSMFKSVFCEVILCSLPEIASLV